jgi:hypothetical protein
MRWQLEGGDILCRLARIKLVIAEVEILKRLSNPSTGLVCSARGTEP